MKKRRLTKIEFDVLLPFLTISHDRTEAAKAALVDGEKLQVIADRYGWTRQGVNMAVTAVWKVREKYIESEKLKNNETE